MTSQEDEFIDQDVAESVLLQFGIKKSSSAYDRWLTNGGFYLKDFDEVLFLSPHIVSFDWRVHTDQIGLQLKRVLQLCDIQMDWTLSAPTEGYFIRDGVKLPVSYDPAKGDKIGETVSNLLSELRDDKVNFFAETDNAHSDTVTFAILRSKNAQKLIKDHGPILAYYFEQIEAVEAVRNSPPQNTGFSILNFFKSVFPVKTD